MFNIFIFMQIYNLLNCRKIDETINFFEGLNRNIVFVMVWCFIFTAQILLGQYGGLFFSVYVDGLKPMQWCIVLLVGLVVIPTNLFSKWLIFGVLKLGDGEDDLDEEAEEEEGANKD